MSLKVVGAGLGRTGTHSLKIALERLLGAPCYHMVEVFQRPQDVPVCHDAAVGNPVDWQGVMSGYSAAVDWPAAAHWQNLSQAFPDAIIVLSERDADKWWESASATIFAHIDEDPPEERRAWTKMVGAMMENTFTTDLKNPDAAKAAFQAHNAKVKAEAPKDRLLVWEATHGWEPLCAALKLEVPKDPFPKANTKEEFLARLGANQT
jgi:hypothetical protein